MAAPGATDSSKRGFTAMTAWKKTRRVQPGGRAGIRVYSSPLESVRLRRFRDAACWRPVSNCCTLTPRSRRRPRCAAALPYLTGSIVLASGHRSRLPGRVRHRRHGRGVDAGDRGPRQRQSRRHSASSGAAPIAPAASGGWDLWQATLKQGRWQDAQAAGDQLQGQRFRSVVQRRRTLAVLLLQSRRRLGRRRSVSRQGARRRQLRRGRKTSVPASTARATNGRRRRAAMARRCCSQATVLAAPAATTCSSRAGTERPLSIRKPVPGVNTKADEFDAAWLGGGEAIVFARSQDVEDKPMQLLLARCDGKRYADAVPLTLVVQHRRRRARWARRSTGTSRANCWSAAAPRRRARASSTFTG